MKTAGYIAKQIEKLKLERLSLITNGTDLDLFGNPVFTFEEKPVKRIDKKIEHLEMVQRILETNPSENLLKSQLEVIGSRIKEYEQGFEAWIENQGLSVEGLSEVKLSLKKKEFRATFNLPKLRKLARNLRFILEDDEEKVEAKTANPV